MTQHSHILEFTTQHKPWSLFKQAFDNTKFLTNLTKSGAPPAYQLCRHLIDFLLLQKSKHLAHYVLTIRSMNWMPCQNDINKLFSLYNKYILALKLLCQHHLSLSANLNCASPLSALLQSGKRTYTGSAPEDWCMLGAEILRVHFPSAMAHYNVLFSHFRTV